MTCGLNENKASLKPTTKPYNLKKQLPRKEQSKRKHRKKAKRKGKSGGLRIINYISIEIQELKNETTIVYLLSIYDKSDTEKISDSAELLPFRENVVIYNGKLQMVFAFNRDGEPLTDNRLRELKSNEETCFQHGNLHAIAVRHTSHSGKEYLIVAESIFNSEELGNLRNIQ